MTDLAEVERLLRQSQECQRQAMALLAELRPSAPSPDPVPEGPFFVYDPKRGWLLSNKETSWWTRDFQRARKFGTRARAVAAIRVHFGEGRMMVLTASEAAAYVPKPSKEPVYIMNLYGQFLRRNGRKVSRFDNPDLWVDADRAEKFEADVAAGIRGSTYWADARKVTVASWTEAIPESRMQDRHLFDRVRVFSPLYPETSKVLVFSLGVIDGLVDEAVKFAVRELKREKKFANLRDWRWADANGERQMILE